MTTTDLLDTRRRATDAAGRGVAPWIEGFARLGYAAKSLLYATIGVLAARTALGVGGATTDSRGALRAVLQAPFGRVMLLLIAVGLAGYAAWRVVEAMVDPERCGTGARALLVRASLLGRGALHAALALSALRLLAGDRDEARDGDNTREWAALVMDWPGGRWLLMAIGVCVLLFGVYEIYRSLAARISRSLDLGRLSAETDHRVYLLCRFGIAARGVVFSLVGYFLIRAATNDDVREAGGLRQSLETLAHVGRGPLAIVALGLVAYGVNELVNARYRRIRVS